METLLIIVCICACVICPLVTLGCILVSSISIQKHIQSLDDKFSRAEEIIFQFTKSSSSMASCVKDMETMVMTLTREYTHQIEKLQDCRDKAVELGRDLSKATAILSSAATSPRNVINNNAHE